MLRTKVILSHVTNLSDARYAAGMGVNYIGFAVDPENRRYVTATEAKTISDWLSGVSIIAETGTSLPAELQDYKYSLVQTSNSTLIPELEKPILQLELNEINVAEIANLLANHAAAVGFFILSVDGEQLSALQEQLLIFCNDYAIYIDTAFDGENLGLVIEGIKPLGIVIYGSNEEKPGLSSYDGIADILEQLEED
jgi:phosphoribosylanthranilate isomerase